MFFLFRSFVCILIVYIAVQWREPDASLRPVTAKNSEAALPLGSKDLKLMAQASAEAGLLAVSDLVKEKCLTAAQECVDFVKRVQRLQNH